MLGVLNKYFEFVYEINIIIPILQMKSVRLREVKGGKPD